VQPVVIAVSRTSLIQCIGSRRMLRLDGVVVAAEATKCGGTTRIICTGNPIAAKTPTGQGRRSVSVQRVLHLPLNPLVLHMHFGGVLRPNALILLHGSSSAGIANNFNEMRVLFSLNSCTILE
jgi:hypothetical protein